jgi:hypothetical protein
MWHMYVRKAAAESAAPSGVSQGTSKREIRSCAIPGPRSALKQPGSQARLFASNGRRMCRSFRLVRVGGTRDVRLDPSRGWHRQVITVARQWATPTEACQRPLSSLQALGS